MPRVEGQPSKPAEYWGRLNYATRDFWFNYATPTAALLALTTAATGGLVVGTLALAGIDHWQAGWGDKNRTIEKQRMAEGKGLALIDKFRGGKYWWNLSPFMRRATS